MATSEPQQQDQDGDQQPGRLADTGGRLLEGEEQVAPGLDPQPARASDRAAKLVEHRLEAVQVSCPEGLALGVLDADQRHATVGRDRARLDGSGETRAQRRGGIGRSKDVGQRGQGGLDRSHVRLKATGAKEAGSPVVGSQDHIGAQTLLGRCRPL
jgi:hypothetical protein